MSDTIYFFSSELEEWESRILQHGGIDWVILSGVLLGSYGTCFCWGRYESSLYGYNDTFHDVKKLPDYGKYISKPLSLILIGSGTC